MGVRTSVTREFFTDFAKLALTSSWDLAKEKINNNGNDDYSSSNGAVSDAQQQAKDGQEGAVNAALESRRAALLAVFQENLVLRSKLIGRILDRLEATRPGYMPAEVMARVSER